VKAEPSIQIFTGSHDGAWRLWDAGGGFNKVHEEKVGLKVHKVVSTTSWLFVAYDRVYDATMATGEGAGNNKATNYVVGSIMGYPLNPSGPGVPFHLGPMALYASGQSVKTMVAAGEGNACVVVATGGDGMGRVWGIDAAGVWRCKSVLSGHVREVTGLAFSGGHLWSCGTDAQIRIWDMGSGEVRGEEE